jgi:hypothetical protein
MKKTLPALLSLTLIATPALAQEENDSLRDGFDLFSEGSRMILEGLADKMRPLLEEARPFFEDEVAPFFGRIWDLMDDLAAYEMPERLPNGDIIIRRRPDAPDLPDDPDIGDGGAVDL